MATRRTTMRSGTGTKLYAVRDESGKFKDIQTFKRAHAADLRHKSKEEKEAAQGPIERGLKRAANDAVKSVKDSVTGAVAAVKRVAKRAARQVSGPAARKTNVKAIAKKAVRTPRPKTTAKKAVRKSTAKPRTKST